MKLLPPVVLVDKDTAGVLLRKRAAVTRIRHVVSIGAPETEPPAAFETHPSRKVRLEFDDIESKESRADYVGPSMEDVIRLLQFYDGIDQERPGVILIHCAAGISRSSAATLLLLAKVLGPGKEEEAVQKLLAVRAQTAAVGLRHPAEIVRPNRRFVWLGDQALRRDGRLLEACVRGIDVYRDTWSP